MKIKNVLMYLLTTTAIISPQMSIADTGNDYIQANSQYYEDGTDLLNVGNIEILNQPFVTKKKMYKITDATATLKLFNLNLIIDGKSSINPPSDGVQIVSNGTLKDFINLIGSKFNYSSWTLQQNNIIFKPDVPYVQPLVVKKTTPTPTTVATTAAATTTAAAATTTDVNKTTSSSVAIKDIPVESSNVKSATPTTPIISNAKDLKIQNTSNTTWAISISDRTIKKTLQKWSDMAGWQLIWKSNVDFPITANANINGSYQDAIVEVCRSSQLTGAKIEAVFHPKNNVVVIQTQDL